MITKRQPITKRTDETRLASWMALSWESERPIVVALIDLIVLISNKDDKEGK